MKKLLYAAFGALAFCSEPPGIEHYKANKVFQIINTGDARQVFPLGNQSDFDADNRVAVEGHAEIDFDRATRSVTITGFVDGRLQEPNTLRFDHSAGRMAVYRNNRNRLYFVKDFIREQGQLIVFDTEIERRDSSRLSYGAVFEEIELREYSR